MPLYKGSQEITGFDMTAYYTIPETHNRFVEKVPNMGLSKNDFDDTAKAKSDFEGSETLSGLASMAVTNF